MVRAVLRFLDRVLGLPEVVCRLLGGRLVPATNFRSLVFSVYPVSWAGGTSVVWFLLRSLVLVCPSVSVLPGSGLAVSSKVSVCSSCSTGPA